MSDKSKYEWKIEMDIIHKDEQNHSEIRQALERLKDAHCDLTMYLSDKDSIPEITLMRDKDYEVAVDVGGSHGYRVSTVRENGIINVSLYRSSHEEDEPFKGDVMFSVNLKQDYREEIPSTYRKLYDIADCIHDCKKLLQESWGVFAAQLFVEAAKHTEITVSEYVQHNKPSTFILVDMVKEPVCEEKDFKYIGKSCKIDRRVKLARDLRAKFVKGSYNSFEIQIHWPSHLFKKLSFSVNMRNSFEYEVLVENFYCYNNGKNIIHRDVFQTTFEPSTKQTWFQEIIRYIALNLKHNEEESLFEINFGEYGYESVNVIAANLIKAVGYLINKDLSGYLSHPDPDFDMGKLRMHDESWTGGRLDVASPDRQDRLLEAGYEPFLVISDTHKEPQRIEIDTTGKFSIHFGHTSFRTSYGAELEFLGREFIKIKFLKTESYSDREEKAELFNHMFSLHEELDKYKRLVLFSKEVYSLRFDNTIPMDVILANLFKELATLSKAEDALKILTYKGMEDSGCSEDYDIGELNKRAADSKKNELLERGAEALEKCSRVCKQIWEEFQKDFDRKEFQSQINSFSKKLSELLK